MPSLLRLAAPLAASLVLLAGCDDPLAPGDVAGTYVLETVDGDALPAAIAAGPQERVVVSVVIELSDDETGEVSHFEVIDGIGYSSVVSIAYEIAGDEGFVAEFPCPPNALCTAPPHLVGRFRGGRLELSRYLIDGHEWSFGRPQIEAAAVGR